MCFLPINKRTFNSFLLWISSRVSVTGKFDTEYVLSKLKRAAESLKKHSLVALVLCRCKSFSLKVCDFDISERRTMLLRVLVSRPVHLSSQTVGQLNNDSVDRPCQCFRRHLDE